MTTPSENSTSRYLPDLVWHPLEYRRIANLAAHEPSLMNDRELLIWNIIELSSEYWNNDEPDFAKIGKDWVKIQIEAEKMKNGQSLT